MSGIKRGESKLASNRLLMCAPQSRPLRNVTELYREEKRRGRKETEVARRIKGGIKRIETDRASNQFLKCSPPSGTHKEIQSWVQKRRGREEIEVTWWRKRRVQSEREQSSQ